MVAVRLRDVCRSANIDLRAFSVCIASRDVGILYRDVCILYCDVGSMNIANTVIGVSTLLSTFLQQISRHSEYLM